MFLTGNFKLVDTDHFTESCECCVMLFQSDSQMKDVRSFAKFEGFCGC